MRPFVRLPLRRNHRATPTHINHYEYATYDHNEWLSSTKVAQLGHHPDGSGPFSRVMRRGRPLTRHPT